MQCEFVNVILLSLAAKNFSSTSMEMSLITQLNLLKIILVNMLTAVCLAA